MQIALQDVERLRFPDGTAVRAASAVDRFGDGFLVVQDDATHAAWYRRGSAVEVRLLPPVDGHDDFAASAGTKHLKPDLEASCRLDDGGRPVLVLLGSGSSRARMRVAALRLRDGGPRVEVADLTPLYLGVAGALGMDPDTLNLEGACLVDGMVRWYQRGLPTAGLPSGSVDLDPAQLLAAIAGRIAPGAVALGNPRVVDAGEVDGVGLAVTDVVTLPDGSVLASAVAEDSPNVRDDGPVVASALVHLTGSRLLAVTPLPLVEGRVSKVEGLMLDGTDVGGHRVLAVVDADDPDAASLCLRLRVTL